MPFAAPFRWLPGAQSLGADEFTAISAAQMWARLEELQRDPNGEAAFARQFALWDEAERCARIQRPLRGDLETLNGLLHDLLRGAALWDELPTLSEVSLLMHAKVATQVWAERGPHIAPALAAPIEKGARQLRAYFQPFDRTIAGFLCVRQGRNDSILANVSRPTKHQQLEAHLRFREWVGSM